MGQRLNIEIVNGETSMANAYYHWSAYTKSALYLTKEIIDAFYGRSEPISLKMAVELLEVTGAGVNENEEEEIRKQPNKFGHIKFNQCIDRNEGLLYVTETGKASVRSWEEGRVTIDLSTETFCFDVMCLETPEDYIEYHPGKSINDMTDCPFDLECVRFDEIDELIRFVYYYRCARYDGLILEWVE